MNTKPLALLLILAALSSTASAVAAPKKVGAGETLNLSQDLILSGDQDLIIEGTAEKPCLIEGNTHQIKSAEKWSGQVKIAHARFHGVGAKGTEPQIYSLDLRAAGESTIDIESCIFDASAAIRIDNGGNSRTTFRNNTILDNTLAAQSKDIGDSRPVIEMSGSSTAPKLIQGNRIYRGEFEIRGEGAHYLVGGDSEAQSNIFIGIRVKISVPESRDNIIRGNYIHVLMPRNEEFPYYSQVSTVNPGGSLCELNVIRDGEWIVQFLKGELRYNLICDINDHNLMRNGSMGHVHHNIFFVGKPKHPPGSMAACIMIVYGTDKGGDGMEINNNTFDGCGTFEPPGIEICEKGLVKSLRNNVFLNFAHAGKYGSAGTDVAMVHPMWADTGPPAGPTRVGYADYNCFFSPNARIKDNYALSVSGKSERKDDGFAKHDLPVGGEINAQTDPKFKGPLPKEFSFDDEEIKAGKVTVSQILKHFRNIYTPAEGSPLIDAGDPGDGAGADIGAVGAGKPNAADWPDFGKR